MSRLPTVHADTLAADPGALAAPLRAAGMCWIAGWPTASMAVGLRRDLRRLQSTSQMAPAAVGRGVARARRADVRGDATCWLDDPGCGDCARAFLAQLDGLRSALNQALYLGLSEVEAHYSAYSAGAGYARHRDRFRDSDARVLSWVTYLNEDWRDEDGGALRLYLAGGTIDVQPCGGSICFLSEIEHEVLPAMRERLGIAAWFRR